MSRQIDWLWRSVFFGAFLLGAQAFAVSPDKNKETLEIVDLFEGIKNKQIETKYVARNANQGNLLVRNLSDKEITVRIPEAFGAVPVLGQFGGGMGGMGMGGMGMGGGMGGMGMGGGGQAMGGGGMGGMGMGGMGMGGGMFRVAPEKTTKIESKTVCLEYGKPDPTPSMAYDVIPIERVTQNQRVVELCKMITRGEIPVNVAQAAAWNLANGLSWEKLASLDRVRSKYNGNIKYFNGQELQMAVRVVAEATRRAEASENEERKYSNKDARLTSSAAD